MNLSSVRNPSVSLTDEELRILHALGHPLTFGEVARLVGVTREGARYIHDSAIAKIREAVAAAEGGSECG